MALFYHYRFLALILLITGCAHVPTVPNRIIPLESFVEVGTTVTGPQCTRGNECKVATLRMTSSGSIVDVSDKGSFILGVWHVCRAIDLEKREEINGAKTVVKFIVKTIDGVSHTSTVLKVSRRHDLCLMFVPGLRRFSPIKVRKNPPVYGEHAYNLASPAGIASSSTVPLFNGYYSGFMWGSDMYTIPSMGGSSGSPIIDARGRLLGVLHSYDRRFPIISYSSAHRAIREFLSNLEEIKNDQSRR